MSCNGCYVDLREQKRFGSYALHYSIFTYEWGYLIKLSQETTCNVNDRRPADLNDLSSNDGDTESGSDSSAAVDDKTPSTPQTPVPDPWSDTSSSEPSDALSLWYKKYLSQQEPLPSPVAKVENLTDFIQFLSDLSNQDSDGGSKIRQPVSSQVQVSSKQSAPTVPSKDTSPKEKKDHLQTTSLLSLPSATPSSLPQDDNDDSIILRLCRKSSSTDDGEERACSVGFEKKEECEVVTKTDSASDSRRSEHRDDPKMCRWTRLSPSPERPKPMQRTVSGFGLCSVFYRSRSSGSESTTEATPPRADSSPRTTRQRHCEQRKTYKGANSPLTTREVRRRKARGKTPVNPETPWHNKLYWKTSDESEASSSDGTWSNSGYETPVNKWERPSRSLSYNAGGSWSTSAYGKTLEELCRSPSPPPSPTPPPPIPRHLRPYFAGRVIPPSPPPPSSPMSPRHPKYPLRHGVGNKTKLTSFPIAPDAVLGWPGPERGPLPSTSIYPDCRISKFEGFSTESDEEQTAIPKRVKSEIKKVRQKRKPVKRLKKGVKAPEYIWEKTVFIGRGHGIRYLESSSPGKDDQPKTAGVVRRSVYHSWTPPHTNGKRATLTSEDVKGVVPGAGTPPTGNLSSPSHPDHGDDTTPSPCDSDKADRPKEDSQVHHIPLPSAAVPNTLSPARVDVSSNVVVYDPLLRVDVPGSGTPPTDNVSIPSHTGRGDDRKEQIVTTTSPCGSDKADRPKEDSQVHYIPLISAAVPNTLSPARVDVSSNVVVYDPLLQGHVPGSGTPPTNNVSSPSHTAQRDDRKERTATTSSPRDLDKADRPKESLVHHTPLPSASVPNIPPPAWVDDSSNVFLYNKGPRLQGHVHRGRTLPKDNLNSPSHTGQGDDSKQPTATTSYPCDSGKVDRPEEDFPAHYSSVQLLFATVTNTASPAKVDPSLAYGPPPQGTGIPQTNDDTRERTATTPSPCDSGEAGRHEEKSSPSAIVPNTALPGRVEASTNIVAYGPLPQAIDACDTQAAWETGSKTPSAPRTPVPDPWSETSSSEPSDALSLWYKKYLSQQEPVPNPVAKVANPTDFTQFLSGVSNQCSGGGSQSSQPFSSQVQLNLKQSASTSSDSDASTSSSEESHTSSEESQTSGSNSASSDSRSYQKKRKHTYESEESSCPYRHFSSSDQQSRSNTRPRFYSRSSPTQSHKRRRHDDTSGSSMTALTYVTSSSDSNTGTSSRSEGSSLGMGSRHSSNSNGASGHSCATSRGLKRKAEDCSPNPKRFRKDDSSWRSGSDNSSCSSESNSRSSHSKGSGNSKCGHNKDSRDSTSSHSKGSRKNRRNHSKSRSSSNNRDSNDNSSHSENSRSSSNSRNCSNNSDNTDDSTNTSMSAFG
ncbi:Hypp4814 [Branchiostoma lanceolatum]|uniref:Hypp4814 protein n=1 Tax=Branchiostoma lanceolatum TaxID=7740 RepID=A0A8K0ABK3_BRALA|nr:Hypp4814 [Branchiostoma lanceolatum]